MELIAHRGGAGLRVENTLAAFENAINLGAAGAELDVHLSRDGQVVVHHDDILNSGYCRHAGGEWLSESERHPLSELSYAQMQNYEIGVPKTGTKYARKFDRIEPVTGQHIPLLRDVIRLIKAHSEHFFLLIEIKASLLESEQKPWKPLVDATLAIIEEEHFAERSILISFDWGALRYAKTHRPDLATWFIGSPLSWFERGQPPRTDIPPNASYLEAIRALYATGDAPWFAGFDPRQFPGGYPQAVAEAGGNAWYPYYRDCTEETCRETARWGLDSAAWTVNLRDKQTLQHIAQTGVDYLAMDYPDIQTC